MAPESEAPASKLGKFKSILEHVLEFTTLALGDVIQYAAPAEKVAQALFPEYAFAEKEAQIKVVQVATLLQKAVISAQQKFAHVPPSPAVSAAKLADVQSTVEQAALSLLADAKISADTTRITWSIEATVAILKTNAAPAL